jgi:eukaryotic-like serine/threonine-protein kinase
MRRTLCLLVCIAITVVSRAAEQPPAFDLVLVDMQGNKKVLGNLPDSVFAPRISPDGKQVAFELRDAPTATQSGPPLQRLYVADLARVDQRRALPFTAPAQQNYAPIWSPDGKRLVYLVSGARPDALYWRRADGSGEAEHLLDARAAEGMYEGGRLSFITLTGNRDYGIGILDINTKAVTRLVDYPGSEQHSSRIAPGGRWFAYVSNETGRQEVWIEPLPQSGQRYQLTKTGGRHPEWSPDGGTLYFDQGNQMFRVDISTAAETPKIGEPVELPIRGFQQGDLRRQYDLMPDGKGFVMLFPIARPAR